MGTTYKTNFSGFDGLTVKQYEECFRKSSEKIKVLEINGKHPSSEYLIKTGDEGKIEVKEQRKKAF